MPHSLFKSDTLLQVGPVVEVHIGLPATAAAILAAQGLALPDQLALNAIIDTGAGGTCFREGVLGPLGLQALGAG